MALILPRPRMMAASSSAKLGPLLLTVPDAARRLRRHEQTVRAMIRRGDLAAIRLGRLVRILAATVDRTGAPVAIGEPTVRPRTLPRILRPIAVRVRV